MSPTRIEQKAATREAIAKAARQRFTEVGFDSTTVRDVAASAGVSVGSVHVHFKDKRALLFACFHAGIESAVAEAWSTLDSDSPLIEQLTHLTRVLFESYCTYPELSRVMFKESVITEPNDVRDEALEPFLARVVQVFLACREKGEIGKLPGEGPLEAQLFFSIYLAILIGGLNGHYGAIDDPKRSAEAWSERVRMLLQVFVEGLQPTRR